MYWSGQETIASEVPVRTLIIPFSSSSLTWITICVERKRRKAIQLIKLIWINCALVRMLTWSRINLMISFPTAGTSIVCVICKGRSPVVRQTKSVEKERKREGKEERREGGREERQKDTIECWHLRSMWTWFLCLLRYRLLSKGLSVAQLILSRHLADPRHRPQLKKIETIRQSEKTVTSQAPTGKQSRHIFGRKKSSLAVILSFPPITI